MFYRNSLFKNIVAAVLLLNLTVPAIPLEARAEGAQRIRLLTKNSEAWNVRYALIKAARKSIVAQYYIIQDDDFGLAFLGLLLEKAKAGVKVKLMVDARGSAYLARKMLKGDYLQELALAGAEVKVYNPLFARGLHLGLMTSNHDKILIIDERVSITGGRNISKDYFLDMDKHPGAFHDADVIMDSVEVAKGLQEAFDREFNHKAAMKFRKDRFGNWRAKAQELLAKNRSEGERIGFRIGSMSITPGPTSKKTEELLEKSLNEIVHKDPEAIAEDDDREVEAYTDESSDYAAGGHGGAADDNDSELEQADASVIPSEETQKKILESLMSGSSSVAKIEVLDNSSKLHRKNRVDQITQTVIREINRAEHLIYIQNPYVVLTPEMKKALKAAGDRGVVIFLNTNSPTSTDSALTQAVFNAEWREMLTDIPQIRLNVSTGPGKLHAKMFMFDKNKAIVGSYNLDYLSEKTNSEIAVYVEDEEFGNIVKRDIAYYAGQEGIVYRADKPGYGPERIPESTAAIKKVKKMERISRIIRPYL